MARFKARKAAADEMDTAARVLALARQTADQAVADAKREAEQILERARQQPEALGDHARPALGGKAEQVLDDQPEALAPEPVDDRPLLRQ